MTFAFGKSHWNCGGLHFGLRLKAQAKTQTGKSKDRPGKFLVAPKCTAYTVVVCTRYGSECICFLSPTQCA